MVDDQSKLETLQQANHRVLHRVASIFPFTLFPTQIIVTESKIDVIYHYFFFSKGVFSIPIEILRSVFVTTNLLFATMDFDLITFEQNPDPIHFLPKAQALRVRDTIMGLMMVKKNKVDITTAAQDMPVSEVKQKMKEIGQVQSSI